MRLASLSVAAVHDRMLVFDHHLGHARFDPTHPEGGPAVNHSTLFRVASISKLITTLGVMKLVERGLLSLDRDLSDYLGFPLRNPHFPDLPITTRMILSHTSSMRDDDGYFWPDTPGFSLRDALTPTGHAFGEGKKFSPHAPPGAFFQYANLPWGVLGTVMERVSGQRFDRLMHDSVLAPLELPGGFNVGSMSESDQRNLATLYRTRRPGDDHAPWSPIGPWIPQADDYSISPPKCPARDDYVIGSNGTLFGPQGSCRTSVIGLARIIVMMLSGGQYEGRRIVSRESIQNMLTDHWTLNADFSNGNSGGEFESQPTRAMNAWGLGAQHFVDISGLDNASPDSSTSGIGDRLIDSGGWQAWGHFGDAYGLRAGIFLCPEQRNGIAFIVGGTSNDPYQQKGHYSANARFEERIISAVYRHVLRKVM